MCAHFIHLVMNMVGDGPCPKAVMLASSHTTATTKILSQDLDTIRFLSQETMSIQDEYLSPMHKCDSGGFCIK